MSLPNFDLAHNRGEGSSNGNGADVLVSASSTPAAGPPRQRRRSSRASSSSTTWRLQLGLHPHTSRSSIFALFLHATCSVLFLVFLNSAQAFLLPLLAASEDGKGRGGGAGDREGLRVGALSGKLQLADEVLSVFLVLAWGSLADRSGLSSPSSSSSSSSSRRIHPPSQQRPRTRRPGRSLLPRGVPLVTSLGYLLVSAGLACYALAEKPWPHLLWARLVFASGASAVTAMLTGALATWAAPVGVEKEEMNERVEGAEVTAATAQGETTPLLASTSSARPSKPARHGRLSALAGLLTGIGAVIAVLVLLPLPVWLAGAASHARDDARLLRATRQAFLLVAALAFAVAVAVALGLREPGEEGEGAAQRARRNEAHTDTQVDAEAAPPPPTDARAARRARLRSRITPSSSRSTSSSFAPLATLRSHITSLLRGFTLARTHPTLLPLAYLGGALARSLTLASTLFLPLYVAHYFYETRPDVCLPPPEDGAGAGTGGPLKETCRQAYMLASAQSGILQTMCLIAAPLAGWACDALGPLGVLLASSVVAGFGFTGYARGEPTLAVAWLSAAMVGLAQGGAIVSSLVLVARGKGVVEAAEVGKEDDDREGDDDRAPSQAPRASTRSAGAISGAYSSCGALCIIIVSSIGGWLFDMRPQAPFFLLAGIGGLVAVATMLGMVAGRRRKQRRQDHDNDDM